VSGGLVNFLQKLPIPDPQITAAPLSAEVGRSLHGLELADTSAHVWRRENETSLQSVAIQREVSGLQHVENEVTGSAQDRGLVEFPILGMAQWPSQQARAAVEEDEDQHRHRKSSLSMVAVNGLITDQSSCTAIDVWNLGANPSTIAQPHATAPATITTHATRSLPTHTAGSLTGAFRLVAIGSPNVEARIYAVHCIPYKRQQRLL
jgi:hypothetical protein